MTATREMLRDLFDKLAQSLIDRVGRIAARQSVEGGERGERALLRVASAFLKDNGVTLTRDAKLGTKERWEEACQLWDAVLFQLRKAIARQNPDPQTLKAAATFLAANGVTVQAARQADLERGLRELDEADLPEFLN